MRLYEALDAERVAVADRLGAKVPDLAAWFEPTCSVREKTLPQTCQKLTFNSDGPYQATGTPGLLRAAGASRLGVGPGAPVLPDALDWQKQTEQAMMRLWNFSRGAVGAIGSGWDDECKAEIRRAREICTKAYANGWESDHDVGPYSKPDGSDWTPQDCMRGLISERCGGNPVDKK